MQARTQFRVGPFLLSGSGWLVLIAIVVVFMCCMCGMLSIAGGNEIDRELERNPYPTYGVQDNPAPISTRATWEDVK